MIAYTYIMGFINVINLLYRGINLTNTLIINVISLYIYI